MLYIIGLIKQGFDATGPILRYNLLDTLTCSHMLVNYKQLKDIISICGAQVANAELHNGGIKLKDWVKKITVMLSETITDATIDNIAYRIELKSDRCTFILLSKCGSKYKIVDYRGVLREISLAELKTLLGYKEVANCSMVDNKNGSKINALDTYEINTDKEFEESIAEKYKIFQAKASILGSGLISFEYAIENKKVILTKYTGSSTHIILPSFITAVRRNSFNNIFISELRLNEGLEFIGIGAFAPNEVSTTLKRVVIPSTVKIIETEAFVNNTKLYTNRLSLNTDKFKLRNSKTVVLGKYV